MGTFPSPSWSHAPHKITTAAVRAQDQVLSTVDAVKSPDSPDAIGVASHRGRRPSPSGGARRCRRRLRLPSWRAPRDRARPVTMPSPEMKEETEPGNGSPKAYFG